MSSFTEILSRYVGSLFYPLSIIVIIFLFMYVGYWAYTNYFPQVKENATFNDVANHSETSKDATVTLYHATWCPACKRAKPEWDSFVEEMNDQQVNGYTVKCTEVDCSNNDDPAIASVNQEHNINGFPTVQMYVDGNTVNFDSAVTKSTLDLFVNKML